MRFWCLVPLFHQFLAAIHGFGISLGDLDIELPDFSPVENDSGLESAFNQEEPTDPLVIDGRKSILEPYSTTEPSRKLFNRTDKILDVAPPLNIDLKAKHGPIPTNEWWGNALTNNMSSDELAGAIWANPYTLRINKTLPLGIQICYSYFHRVIAPRVNGTVKFYTHNITNDLMLSGKELSKKAYQLSNWTEFGVTLRIQGARGYIESHMVQGMAFVTSKYAGITPIIMSENNISSFDRDDDKYIISFTNKLVWVMYLIGDDNIKFTQKDKHTIVAHQPYNGLIRVAVLPKNADPDTYDAYAGCVVLGGRIDAFSEYDYVFEWEVSGITCGAAGLLHFSLPHHREVLSRDSLVDSEIILYSTVRGQMVGQIGRVEQGSRYVVWKMLETGVLPKIGFMPDCEISSKVVDDTKLLKLLKLDIDEDYASQMTRGLYFNGKKYQKYAGLCLMANDSKIVKGDKSLLKKCLIKLKQLLIPFASNNISFPLVYDTVYGGIISSEGLNKSNPYADFGNSLYNDHHFHFPYYLYAAAVLRLLDPDYPIEFDEMFWTLLRDYANPSILDPYFPAFRSFNFFIGYSYARGATLLEDGKDEESSSEDLNSLYAILLWGMVTKRENVEKLGYLMLQINTRVINTYFLMKSDNTVHPPAYVDNRVVGIYFDNKCEYRTWFSPEVYTFHGIQMIPATPMLTRARSLEFIREEWHDILSKQDIIVKKELTNPWISLLNVNYARLNRKSAIKILQRCELDDGLARSWAIYMAATGGPTSCEEPRETS